MKLFYRCAFLFIVTGLLGACANVAPLTLPPDYVAKHATKEVPIAPSKSIATNVSVVQSGI